MTEDNPDALYPYTTADVESVASALIREGDLLALRGQVGSGHWSGNQVTYHGREGFDERSKCTVWRIEYHSAVTDRDSYVTQPDNMPLCRIRKDRARRVTA